MQGCAPGEEQTHIPAQKRGWRAGKEHCGEGAGGPGVQQALHKPAS